MENGTDFNETLVQAVEEKAQWYDNEALPAILEDYRLLHTCVKVIFDFLVNKAMLTPDPYKLDKKISDIKAPENTQFVENEKSVVMGMRFSDYESTLDFLCNYYKFSVSQLTLNNIKKLVELNSSINWSSLSANSNKTNTRVIASMIFSARQNSDALTSSMVNDNLSKASNALKNINEALKEYTDFHKEWYKGQIRKNIILAPNFDISKALASHDAELQLIKKNFAAAMGKIPFYGELIEEIIQEDQSPKKDELQKKILAKLNVEKENDKKKEKKIDTKAMIMGVLQIFASMPPQIVAIAQKVHDNHEVLESEHNSFFDKLKRNLRKAFGIPEKPLFYSVPIVEQTTGARRIEKINYQDFMNDLANRARRYASVAQTNSPAYKKLSAMPEDKIADFVQSQIKDCNHLVIILNSMDDFFKNSAAPSNKSKIKGLKIDITTLKNTIVKANQQRVEYTSYIEEEAQMKKLGITE